MSGKETVRTTRRRYLGTLAALGAGVGATAVPAAAGGDGGKEAPSDFPRVSTRGHFDITWYGDVQLTDGHDETDYDIEGDFGSVGAPDELLVFAHGWLNDDQEGLDTCYTGVTNLGLAGYDAPGIGFSYDSDTWVTNWWDATEIAERNGPKLAKFLADFHAQHGTQFRLVGHSLGARVLLRAIRRLYRAGATDLVRSASLLGGAADNDSVAVGGAYGDAIAGAVGRFDNYWKDDDDVLQWAYSTAEFDSAVGEEGCEGTPPGNYADHDVDYVPDHFSYYYEGDGCLPAVVEEF